MSEKEKFIQMLQNDKNSEEYQRLETLINENKTIKGIMIQLKTIQKQMINANKIEKTNAYLQLETTYQKMLSEITEYPLMEQYLELQKYFNEILKETTEIIENSLNNDNEL